VERLLVKISKFDTHHRVLCGLIAAAITGIAMRGHPLWTATLGSYDSFAFVSLVLLLITAALTSRNQIRLVAQKQNLGRTIIFAFVISAACAALFAVAFLIRDARAQAHYHFTLHLLLAVVTVVLSWLLMHMVFGLRYAHNFYVDDDDADDHAHAGGLQFPEESNPDYRDFTYFSFVIGMTCQVSDVQVTSREMRRLVLLHGVLSFAFNTVILALTINTVSSLL
jgi:uncharacterized membrane protein